MGPYGSILAQINAGDRIYIRRGIYHEAIIIDNIDSTLGNETLISNYNNEEVVIDGTISIDGSWTDDTIGGVAVKKNIGITQSISQLFVGNNQMVMARWPNAKFSDNTIWDNENYWAIGTIDDDENAYSNGTIIDDPFTNSAGTAIDLNAAGFDLDESNKQAIAILNLGSFLLTL